MLTRSVFLPAWLCWCLTLAPGTLIPVAAQAPARAFRSLSLDEGLSQSTVTAILQDRHGFLWIGTKDGLNRYDGYGFTVFRNDPALPEGLRDDLILSLFEDSQGRLWIGTAQGGLHRYDRSLDAFVPYGAHPDTTQASFPRAVHSIQEDTEGALWFGTPDDGLYRFDPGTGALQHFVHDPAASGSLPDDDLRSVLVDPQSRVWVGTATGLCRLDRQWNRFHCIRIEPPRSSAADANVIMSLYQDRQGALWIGSLGGAHVLDPTTGRLTSYVHDPSDPFSLGNNYVRAITEDPEGNVLLGTEAGIDVFDRQTGRFFHYRHDPLDDGSLTNDAVGALYHDTQGNLWAGTYYGGLNVHYNSTRGFEHVRPDASGRQLGGRIVRALLEDSQGVLWIGTEDGGLDAVHPGRPAYAHYRHTPGTAQSLLGNNIHGVVEDARHNLWIGSFGGGVDYLDRQTGRITHYRHDRADPRSLSSNDVLTLFLDTRERLWVGTVEGGLNLFNPETRTFTRFQHDGQPGSLSFNAVTAIYEDRSGRLWVGTGKGLNRFEPETGTFQTYVHDPSDPNSLSLNNVTTIRQDGQGRLWIGTLGGGLNRYHPATETFTRYTVADGLPSDVVNAIEEDGRGRLWVSTNAGLSCFSPDTRRFVNYTRSDGLQSNQFNVSASLRLRSGELIFGGINGLNRFHPDSIRRAAFEPPVLLTGFQISHQPVPIGAPGSPLQRHVSETREIRLSHAQAAFLTFGFVALSYAPANETRYAYRLRGSHDDWIPAGSQRTATYTHLAPGTYTFEVRAAGQGGAWSDQPASVRLVVAPPLWRTWYAYLCYAALAAGLLYFLQRYSLIVVRRKNALLLEHVQHEKDREVSELKMDFLTNVSHELRTPLTLILGPVQTLLAHPAGPLTRRHLESIHRNAVRLLRMVDQLMDLRKLDAGSLRLQAREGDLAGLARETTRFFDEIADEKQIRFTFTAEPAHLPAWFDRDKIEGVLCNLLANAFKYTPDGGRIDLRVGVAPGSPEGWAVLRVSDSGPGIAPEDQPRIFERFFQGRPPRSGRNKGTGIGLALGRELVALHRGTIEVESRAGEGATFTVRLPLGHLHLLPDEMLPPEPPAEIDAVETLASGYDFEPAEITATVVDAGGDGSGDAGGDGHSDGGVDASGDGHSDGSGDGATAVGVPALGAERPLVLVVEDDLEVRAYLRTLLQDTYRIATAADGKEGVALARDRRPDLIVSDVMMAEVDGMELCRQLKTHFVTSHIPIILLTARRTSTDQQIEGLETGADDYIVKPFHPGLLRTRIQALIQSRKQLRERFKKEHLLQPVEVTVTSTDEQFLTNAIAVVERHLDDPAFTVDQLVDELPMSRTAAYAKFKDLTDLTPGGFIRLVRMKRAAQLLSDTDMSIAQVTYAVGYNDLKYFRKCFQQEYGMTPSMFVRQPPAVQARIRDRAVPE